MATPTILMRRAGAAFVLETSSARWSLAESVTGSGEPPGSSSVSDGHACLPRALVVRAINDDPAVSSDGGLAAQRSRRRCVACVETLVQQARALIMSGTHGHVFLEL